MKYQIKRLGKNDLKLMNELLGCFGQEFEEPETYNGNRPDEDYQRELLANKSFIALVAVVDGQVVGGLAAYELKKFEQKRSEIYIYDLAVAKNYRRQGIATSLIENLKPIAKELGAWVIFIQADSVNQFAVRLYSKLGLREDVIHFDIPVT